MAIQEYNGFSQAELQSMLYHALRDDNPKMTMREALNAARGALEAYAAHHYQKGYSEGLHEQPVTSVDDLLDDDDDDGVVLSNSHEWSARFE